MFPPPKKLVIKSILECICFSSLPTGVSVQRSALVPKLRESLQIFVLKARFTNSFSSSMPPVSRLELTKGTSRELRSEDLLQRGNSSNQPIRVVCYYSPHTFCIFITVLYLFISESCSTTSFRSGLNLTIFSINFSEK